MGIRCFCLTLENSSPNDPKLRITFLLFNIDFQKVLAEFCSLKSFLYTVLSIATAKMFVKLHILLKVYYLCSKYKLRGKCKFILVKRI